MASNCVRSLLRPKSNISGTATRCMSSSWNNNNGALVQQQQQPPPTRSSTRKNSSRPRLKALQEQLELDDQQDAIVKIWNQKPTITTTTPTTESPTTTLSLDELKQQLAKLPPFPKKLVLTDKYRRYHSYLRLSLVERCNLRCQYCMPPEGVPLSPSAELLSTAELLKLTRLFVKNGVTKIRLTGGEPLLRKDLRDIIQELSSMPSLQQIGITTNGVTLSSSSQLQDLKQAGLTHINISLDTLDPHKFQQLTRRNAFDKVWRSIEAACRIYPDHGHIKLNMVVMKGMNHGELADFCLLTKQFPNLDVRFIEWMPFSDNGWDTDKFLSYKDMLKCLEQDGIALDRISDGPHDTTKWYKLQDSCGQGRIGFITSMSQHFCSTCNRLRLTANGQIKVCLFGTSELSLRDALRQGWSHDQLEKLIHYAVQQKTWALGGHESVLKLAKHSSENRPMTLIGG